MLGRLWETAHSFVVGARTSPLLKAGKGRSQILGNQWSQGPKKGSRTSSRFGRLVLARLRVSLWTLLLFLSAASFLHGFSDAEESDQAAETFPRLISLNPSLTAIIIMH